MKLTLDAYLMALLMGRANARGESASKVALITNHKGAPLVLAKATGTAPGSTRTAAVNAIQQLASAQGAPALKKAVLYTTEAPTEMCLGMARRAAMTGILSCASGTLRYYATPLDSHPGAGAVQSIDGGSRGYFGPSQRTQRGWRDVTDWLTPAKAGGTYKQLLIDFLAGDTGRNGTDAANAISRLSFLGAVPAQTFPIGPNATQLGFSAAGLSQAEKDLIFLGVAHQIVARTWGQREIGDTQRPSDEHLGWNIGAVLVDASGDRIWGWGVNTNKTNCTRHGEVNLIQQFESTHGLRNLPDGGRFYTTLEPCQMCSGMLATVLASKNIRVIWGQDDVAIKQSALQRGLLGLDRAGSAARFGVHGWAETLALRHEETSQRLRTEAQNVIDDLDRRFRGRRLPDREYRERQAAVRVVEGIDRFGGVQTTEFLRQVEAKIFFEQAEQRRKQIRVNRQLTDLRATIEGLGGTFSPSSVKGAQEVNVILGGGLLVDLAPITTAFEKLRTFVDSVAGSMARV